MRQLISTKVYYRTPTPLSIFPILIETHQRKRRFWKTITDKILKEEMPNVDIGHSNEKIVFDAISLSRKFV